MEFLGAVGAAAVFEILKNAVKRVPRHVDYLFHYERNVKKLNDELEALASLERGWNNEVEEAKRRGKEIHTEVLNWLNEARSVIPEEYRAALLNDENIAKLSCSSSNFPNLVLRYKRSRQAKEIVDRVSEIKARPLGQVAHRPHLDKTLEIKGYEAFETRRPVFDKIMEVLRDPDVSMIGMYGMAGLGKTMLAKHIAGKAKEEKLFDEVFMVPVSETPDLEKIRREIEKKLSPSSSHETQDALRADQLRERSSTDSKRKILIILDDVWKEIDPIDVGIDFKDEKTGYKLLITTRRRIVFNPKMKTFPVKALSEDEATKLFCEVVGDLSENPDYNDLLKDLVSECGGLPLVINVVARVLQGKPLFRWRAALNDMRNFAPENIEGMTSKVYMCIKTSFDYSEINGAAKSLLLLCSMFPEDTLISADELLMYSVGQVEPLDDARDSLYTYIDILRDNCLLLPSDESPFHYQYHWVKVHDVIRDVAKSIASKKGMISIETITKLEENHKDTTAISLLCDFAGQLPNRLVCPELESFLVLSSSNSNSLRIIPDHFFEETKKLRILSLSFVSLKSPPSSFSCLLENLQTLRLIGCELEDTSFIGGLKSLKCLDLSCSRFEKLSKQIGQLTRLQLLALDYCEDLKVIEPTVISSLIHLEELRIREVNLEWEVERVHKEIKNLPWLNTLYIRIQKADLMPKDLFTDKLKRYEIIVGDEYAPVISQYSRFLYLKLYESKLLYDCGLEKLIKQSERLELEGCVGVANNICELDSNAFPLLKVFKFESNEEVQYIVNSIKPPAFQNLETMRLSDLTNLQKICHGELMKGSFSKLKHVSVSSCVGLKNLIPYAIVGQLEEIIVSGCMMIEEIVVCRREDGAYLGIHEFPKLRSLELTYLPKLVQFLSCEWETSSCSSPLDCSLPLFNEKVAFPYLEKLELSSLDSARTLWPDQLPEVSYMQNLKELSIWNCHSLKHLFSIDMAEGFLQLEKLEVRKCNIMEEVLLVRKESGEERRLKETILFPKLIKIELNNLSNLKRFCGGETEEHFPNEKVPLKLWLSSEMSYKTLTRLTIKGCKNLEYLFCFATVESLVQVKRLRVKSCYMEEVIVVAKDERENGSFKKISFPKLESLELIDLPKLKRFCETECIECPSLFRLDISHCPELRTFISNSAMPITSDEVRERDLVAQQPLLNETVVFPRLEHLIVRDCTSLKYLLSYGIAGSLLKLQSLRVQSCAILEEVVVIKQPFEDERLGKISFSKLQNVKLHSLPKLKRFFTVQDRIECPFLLTLDIKYCHELGTSTPIKKDERDLVGPQPLCIEKVAFSNTLKYALFSGKSFKNVERLEISECNNLEYLLPLDMFESLAQLKVLKASNCDVIEEVIVVTKSAREEGSFKKISFPKLEHLCLQSLPKLRRFCEANYIECPSLLRLEIEECPEMRICFANSASTPMLTAVEEENKNRDMVAQQPLLIETVAFPNLEELILDGTMIEIVTEKRPSQSSVVPFPKLQRLDLICSEDRNQGVFSFDIDNYQNLESVNLGGFSCMKKLRQCRELGDAEEYGGRTLTRLKILYINSCGRLKTLSTSSSAYFQNLQDLRVSECHGMINLLSSSAVKSLVQLKTMIITKCNQMREVIMDKDDETASEIVFSRLKTLGLHCLPSLQSFNCGNSNIQFPKLKKVIVSACPEMETFSRGTVITPKLDRVISEIRLEEDDPWPELKEA